VVPERRDSFPALSDTDRALLNRVLSTAQQALTASREAAEAEARARANLEGKLLGRVGEVEERVEKVEEIMGELRSNIAELRGIGGDLKGLRGDFSGLSTVVMQSIRTDAELERRFGELALKLEMQTNNTAQHAGKSSGAKWGAILGSVVSVAASLVTIIYLIAYVGALYRNSPPPNAPSSKTP
jgi:tetrahydromethanopterin S-methyltransferase subunit G